MSSLVNDITQIEVLVAVVLQRDVSKEGLSKLRIEQKDAKTSEDKAFPVVSSSVESPDPFDVRVLMTKFDAIKVADATRAGDVENLKRENSEFREKVAENTL